MAMYSNLCVSVLCSGFFWLFFFVCVSVSAAPFRHNTSRRSWSLCRSATSSRTEEEAGASSPSPPTWEINPDTGSIFFFFFLQAFKREATSTMTQRRQKAKKKGGEGGERKLDRHQWRRAGDWRRAFPPPLRPWPSLTQLPFLPFPPPSSLPLSLFPPPLLSKKNPYDRVLCFSNRRFPLPNTLTTKSVFPR